MVLAVALKVVLAALTPLGFDFIDSLHLATSGNSDLASSPWILFVRGVYLFWLWLPIQHSYVRMTASTLISSSYCLLTVMVKAPIVICDLLTALTIYRLSSSLRADGHRIAKYATTLWLANPYVTFLGEMWGSIDVILVFLTILCVALVISSRRIAASFPLALAIATRLSPIVAWLGILVWVLRKPRRSYKETLALGLAGPVGVLGYLFWLTRGQLGKVLDMSSLLSTYSSVTQPFYQYTSLEVFSYSRVFGFAVASVLFAALLAWETWPLTKSNVIGLLAVEFLLVYSFAVWAPTAFLWVMPYLALWHAQKRGRSFYLLSFLAAISVSVLVFNSGEITSNGSFLFIPRGIVPFGEQLASIIRATIVLSPILPLIRSLIVGFMIVYAVIIFHSALVSRTVAEKSASPTK